MAIAPCGGWLAGWDLKSRAPFIVALAANSSRRRAVFLLTAPALTVVMSASAVDARPFSTSALLDAPAYQVAQATSDKQRSDIPSRKRPIASASDTGEVRLEPVVVSATRTATSVSELTRSVSVVQREEVARQSAIDPNLSSILGQTVPGLSPSTQGLTTFGQTLRGRDFLTLIDGVPQTTTLRATGRDLNAINPEAIERIEVVRGGSAIYGFGATGGVVNIITREPEPGPFNAHSEAGFRVSTEQLDDSLELNTAHQASGTTEQFDYLLSGSFVDRRGQFDADGDRIPPNPFGVQGGYADTAEFDVLGKLGRSFDDDRQRLEFMTNYYRIRQDTDFTFGEGDPAAAIETPAVTGNADAREPGTENTTARLSYDHEDIAGSNLNVLTYYEDLEVRFAKFPDFVQTQTTSEKFGARSTVDTPFSLGGFDLAATYGVDYLHDETEQIAISFAPNETPPGVPELEQDAVAGFLQLEAPVTDWMLMQGGVRHERIWLDVADVVNRNDVFVQGGDLDFNETLFNLGSVFFVSDNVEVFGSYSQGFSLADLGRVISDATVPGTRAEDVQAEVQKVDNYELGVRGGSERVNAEFAVFYSESANGLAFDEDLSIIKQPEEIWGVETALNARASERWSFGGTFTWIEGEVDLDEDGIFEEDLDSTRVPPMKVTAFADYRPFNGWSNRLQALYSADRTPNSTLLGGADVDEYTLLDFYSSVNAGPGRLVLGVDNLLNEDYFPVLSQATAQSYSFIKGPGRTVSLSYAIDW